MSLITKKDKALAVLLEIAESKTTPEAVRVVAAEKLLVWVKEDA